MNELLFKLCFNAWRATRSFMRDRLHTGSRSQQPGDTIHLLLCICCNYVDGRNTTTTVQDSEAQTRGISRIRPRRFSYVFLNEFSQKMHKSTTPANAPSGAHSCPVSSWYVSTYQEKAKWRACYIGITVSFRTTHTHRCRSRLERRLRTEARRGNES